MKIIIVLSTLICFTIFSGTLKAQNFKLQAGLSIPTTTFYLKEYNEYNNFVVKLGFQFGLSYEFLIDEKNILKTGALLNPKGYKSSETHTVLEYSKHDLEVKLFYLDFPLLYQRKFKIKDNSFYAELGPYYGIGLKGKLKSVYKTNDETDIDEIILFGKNKIDYLQPTDYGLVFGIGADFNALQLGLSFTLGLRDISKPDFESMKNRVISVSVAIPLSIKE